MYGSTLGGVAGGMAGALGGSQAMDYAKQVAAQQQYNAVPAPPKDVPTTALTSILDRLRYQADSMGSIAYRMGSIADRAYGPVPTAASGQLSPTPESILGQIDGALARIDEIIAEARNNLERCERIA